jgi:hypothetical protein
MVAVMSTPAYYRHKELECRREAEAAIDQLTKDSWVHMADSWARLAAQVERGLFGTEGSDQHGSSSDEQTAGTKKS